MYILIYKHLRLFNPTVGCFSFLQLADFHSYSWPISVPTVGRFSFLQLAILYLLQQKSKQINRCRHFQSVDIEQNTIRQLRLANYPDFPIVVFLSISFTHHICIIDNAKDLEELDLRRMKNGIGIAHNIEFLPLICDKFHMVLPLICDKNTKMLA